MNGAKKYHSADGPAFNEGEVWVGGGGSKAMILRTERYGVDKWDVDVFYYYPTDAVKTEVRKNAWSFQVRYHHQADNNI